MYTYVRSTKLPDIRGRSEYITNATGKHKEEDVLCIGGATSDWQPYHAYEQAHKRSSEPNNEGRELIVALPNAWGNLINRPLLKNRIDSLAKKLLGKSTDYQFAVHWNSSHTNLHAHIIFSERERNANAPTSDFYDRDIYLTHDGKIARRKADRALNEDGTVKPPIHRKGEPKNTNTFTPKNKQYASKKWLHDVKKTVEQLVKGGKDVKHTPNYLHTYHEGKAPEAAAKAKEKNDWVRQVNRNIEELRNEGYKFPPAGDKAYSVCRKNAYNARFEKSWLAYNLALNYGEISKKRAAAANKAAKKSAPKLKQCEKLAEEIFLARGVACFRQYTSGHREHMTKLLTGSEDYFVDYKRLSRQEQQYKRLLSELTDEDAQSIVEYVDRMVRQKATGELRTDSVIRAANALKSMTEQNSYTTKTAAIELPSVERDRREAAERQRQFQNRQKLSDIQQAAHKEYERQQAVKAEKENEQQHEPSRRTTDRSR